MPDSDNQLLGSECFTAALSKRIEDESTTICGGEYTHSCSCSAIPEIFNSGHKFKSYEITKYLLNNLEG